MNSMKKSDFEKWGKMRVDKAIARSQAYISGVFQVDGKRMVPLEW